MHAALSLEWRDGAFHAQTDVPISDRGFRYGLALFETLRIHGRSALFAEEHVTRLRESALESGWWQADELPEDGLEAVLELLRGMGEFALPTEGSARIHLTAGDGHFTDTALAPRLFLTAQHRPLPEPQIYRDGIRAAIHPHPVIPPPGNVKSHNYWANLTALRAATRLNCSDAVLVGPGGELVSFCLGNLFLVNGMRVATPPLQAGPRRGVTRDWVLGLTEATQSPLTLADLQAADEVFMTNSWYGILPVTGLPERTLAIGPVTSRLIEAFQGLMTP